MMVVKKCLVCGNTDPDSIVETDTGYKCEHCDNTDISVEVIDNDEEII